MIVGRKNELRMLEKIYKSKEAEFVTVYGRRRVGKTYLIREFFTSKKCRFLHATGIRGGTTETQLKKFSEALSHTFFDNAVLAPFKNWGEAFSLLQTQIAKHKEKIVLFLDELPWMATKKSGLLQELEYYWNRYWSGIPQVIVIACGSSASWLIKKIIYNKGGLYNRTTCQIRLLPFTLAETHHYLKSRKVAINQKQVLALYMVLGGIPYYLRYVEPGLSAAQNVQKIIFDKNSPLADEYERLFDSLFEHAHIYKELVKILSRKKEGVGRAELGSDGSAIEKSGGRLSERLEDLKATGFIEEHIPWGHQKGAYYKLIDEFCLFYLHFVETYKGKSFARDFWIHHSQSPAYHSWAGYAFEAVCMKHLDQILHALNIQTSSTIGSWRYTPKRKTAQNGAQIDLIIDRNDAVLNICEIKHTDKPFVVDKPYAEKLKKTIELFKQKTGINKQIFVTFISASGLKKTIYSEDMVSCVVVLDQLFKT
jgi:AAA+ ATPase superfamily predicted ATPase